MPHDRGKSNNGTMDGNLLTCCFFAAFSLIMRGLPPPLFKQMYLEQVRPTIRLWTQPGRRDFLAGIRISFRSLGPPVVLPIAHERTHAAQKAAPGDKEAKWFTGRPLGGSRIGENTNPEGAQRI